MTKTSFRKLVAAGALTLAIAVPAGAGAVSAAPVQVKANVWVAQGSLDSIDWNTLLQQYFQGWTPSEPVTPTKPATPVQPSKPTTPTAPANGGATTGTGTGTGTTGTGSGTNSGADMGAGTVTSTYAQQVVTLVNQERAKAGLQPLKTDAKLAGMALDKAKDLINNNYFSHTSPTYGSPFDMMKSYGISYRSAGENIAKGQRTPQEVMTAWMNSPGHKANILNASYTTIGVGYYNGAWVQEFIG